VNIRFKQDSSAVMAQCPSRQPIVQTCSPLCFLWPCFAVSMHSANEPVYITGKLGAKMEIPVMDGGLDVQMEA